MAKMTLSRARSLIGEIVLAKLDRGPNPVDATEQAARTVIIRWLVDAMDARQLKELAALLTCDFISWPAMRKVMLEDGFPDDRAAFPPRVSRTAADDGRHLTARTLCQPGENETVFNEEALLWPLPPDSDKGDGWDDLEDTRAALLAFLDAVTWRPSGSTSDERKALFERIAARLFEVGALIVAGNNEAVNEMTQHLAEQQEMFDKLPPTPLEDKEIPF